MMTLRHSPTSPFVRKVRMVAIECGLEDRITLQPTDVWVATTDIHLTNPLGKVPALTLEDGAVLYDSPVICEYLSNLAGGRLLPPVPARWATLRQQALADGICDAAILRRQELARPAPQQSADWAERQRRAVARAVDALEAEAPALPTGQPTIGSLAVIAALAYLDFRWAHEPWRDGHPRLAAWFAQASERDSVRRTAPPAA